MIISRHRYPVQSETDDSRSAEVIVSLYSGLHQ